MNKPCESIHLGETRISIIKGDITKQETDALVNAANSSLMGGGGVDGAIHRAGGPEILDECRQIVSKQGRLPPGKAVMTSGGRLKAKYVIHTVGPVWHGGGRGEEALLSSAYVESLQAASEKGLKSVSFPSISTGAYRYPVDDAAKTAISAVTSFLSRQKTSIQEIVFVLFDEKTYESYAMALSAMQKR